MLYCYSCVQTIVREGLISLSDKVLTRQEDAVDSSPKDFVL